MKSVTQIKDLNLKNKPRVSFEFFPPRSDEMVEKMTESLRQLKIFNPEYVSVTYGAGGTTENLTFDIVTSFQNNESVNAASHLTCVNMTKTAIDELAQKLWDNGVKRIVALRGDLPDANVPYTPHPDGYAYAADLVAGLKKIADFDISVAGYPETHPQAESEESDLEHLKRKVDAGASRIITQYSFDTDEILRYRDKVAGLGITVPVVPGILSILNLKQMVSFSARCGANVPQWVINALDNLDEHPIISNHIAFDILAEQCRLLLSEGIEDLHFYTLNRSELPFAMCKMLGLG